MLYITVCRQQTPCPLNLQIRNEAHQGVEVKVSGTAKLVLMILAGIVGIVIVWKLVTGLIATLLSLLLPLAIVLGVGYVIYLAIDKKALSGGRRRYLP